MSFNIENVDTSTFVTIQGKDSSVYYGEIAYIDEHGNTAPLPADGNVPSAWKKVRHGTGIQIFGLSPDSVLCKYEGHWDKDTKHGEGICYFPDKSVYMGNYNHDVKDGYGKFIWANGDVYDGNWKEDRMEGGGKFTHHEGNILGGMFKNNYYHKGGDQFVNPFLSKEEIENIVKRKKEIALAKETSRAQKLFIFEKTNNLEKVIELVKKSNENARVPLIVASKASDFSKATLFQFLSSQQNKECFEFDLRAAAEFKKEPADFQKFMAQVKRNLGQVLTKGEIFCINIDDTNIAYDEIYDPDLREFYNAEHLPFQILKLDELNKPEVYEKILWDTDFRALKLNKSYQLFIWSKFRIESDYETKKIMEKFERRFSSILPMMDLDIIILT